MPSYTPYYSDWKDYPDTSTPITAAVMEHIENGIVDNVGPQGDPGPAGIGGAATIEYQLDSSTAVGDTSIVLDRVGSVPVQVGSIICISAFTTRAELKEVTAVSSETLTVSALRTAHTANDLIVVITNGVLPISYYGIAGDGTDEWAPLQRCVLEATTVGPCLIEGLTTSVTIGKPLMFPTASYTRNLRVTSHASFAPVESNGAMVMVAATSAAISANAATNVFTAPATHGMSSYNEANSTIAVVVNPYGETLPGGFTAGKVYYVDTVPDTTTFTLATSFGSGTKDVTSNGTGWVFTGINSLARVYWESFRVNLTVDNLNGIILGLQQPAWTRNLRVEMDSAVTVAAIGCQINGQLSYHDNIEINPVANAIGLKISGSGHIVRGFNCNGAGTGVQVDGRCHTLRDIWTESCDPAGVELIFRCRGIDLGGTWLHSSGSNKPALLVSSASTSYTLEQIRTSNSDALLIDDTERGIQIVSWDGTVFGDTDSALCFGGWRQEYGVRGPIMRDRATTAVTATYGIRRNDGTILANPASGSFTVTLPTAVGWSGHRVTVVHSSGSGNTVSVDQTGAQTINGSASAVVLNSYERITVVSDGANWFRAD